MTTALTVQARAAVALGSSKAEAELIELAGKSKAIVAITNKDGRSECHAAAMTAKEARIGIEKAGKSAREDATAFSKAVISEEARLVALIKPEETRLIELRDEWDAKVKAEKEAAEALERERIRLIKVEIDDFAAAVYDASLIDSYHAGKVLETLESREIDDSFGEFYGDAVEAKAIAVAKLREIVAAKTSAEATAARIKAEQEAEAARLAEESKRLAAERAEMDRIAAENRAIEAKRQAEERIKLDAERAELDRQRKELADAKAEADAKAAAAKVEADRIAAEEIRKLDEQRKAAAMEDAVKLAEAAIANQIADEAKTVIPVVEQKQEVADVSDINVGEMLVQIASATPARNDDRSGPRVTSLRIQISGELDKMNVFDLSNVLAYCQALPLKNRLAA